MKNILLLSRRQLLAYFRAPLGYTVIIVFLAVFSLSFCHLLTQSATEHIRIGDILFGSAYFWLALLLTIALISMSLFAEERHSGTIETLLTAPVTDAQVVLAKFAAAYVFILIMLAPTLLHSAIIFLLNAEGGSFSFKPIITGYFIVLLISAFYTAFGLLVSSLTRNMVVAAISCCAGMSITFLADNLQYAVRNSWLERMLGQISSVQHVMDFSSGIIDSQPIIFYLSGMVLFLYLTVKSIESRLWR